MINSTAGSGGDISSTNNNRVYSIRNETD